MNTLTPKKILVVHDDRQEWATMSQILLLNGYQVSYAESKEQALKVAKKTRPDLVICSAGGTKLDVAEFLEALKSAPQTRNIPFLLVASSEDGLPARIGELHPNHILLRPFSREQLAIKVQKNLEH